MDSEQTAGRLLRACTPLLPLGRENGSLSTPSVSPRAEPARRCHCAEVTIAADLAADPLSSAAPPVPVGPHLALDCAASYTAAARAASTRAAYRSDWQHFQDWAHRSGYAPLPASPQTVCAYLASHAGVLAVSTLSRRRTTITLAHRAAGLPDPLGDPMAREVWASIRRTHGTAPAGKTALSTHDLARLVAALPTTAAGPARLLAVRDRALLLLGFAAALRRSELTALDVGDLQPDQHGLVVHVRSSKTDQNSAGAVVGLPFGQRTALCPVAAIQAWCAALAAALGVPFEQLDGPLFRPVTRHGRIGTQRPSRGASDGPIRLSAAAVRLVVRRRCEQAGLDPEAYAANSLRSGFATQASANGATERDVMRHGRWRSVTVARGYVQGGNLFTDNAAGRLGL